MRIGILIASEQFSLFTGAGRLFEAAERLGHEPVVLFERSVTYPLASDFPKCDVIVVRPNYTEEPSHHEFIYEALEKSGIPLVNGEVLRTKHKFLQRLTLEDAGVPMPEGAVVQDAKQALLAAERIGYPVMLKVPFGTKGKGVMYAENAETLAPVADYLFVRDQNPFLIEKCIVEAKGSDLRIFVLDGKILGSMKLTAADGEVRSNAGSGGVTEVVEITEEEKTIAIASAKAMNLAIAGVDILRSNAGPLVIEVNANPGFEKLEKTTGVDVASAIMLYAVSLVK